MEALTLFELTSRVRRCIELGLPDHYWVDAELSEVRVNASGHCYVEFIQKSERGNSLLARARGMIWNSTFGLLRGAFREATGRDLAPGIKVRVKVSANFHEQYGFSLVVHDIDPTYTLGDLALRRRQILQMLEADGVLGLNKELSLPLLPLRVAVISSPTAAGYGDFCDQLRRNSGGYPFQVHLFPALMQGERVEESILSALDRIMKESDAFDVVVVIRGGGATADLSAFDSYLLAAACAQFPLPIITGIGHERDDTVLDLVAHTRVKTPTAAAEFLIACVDQAADRLHVLVDRLRAAATQALLFHRTHLMQLLSRLPLLANRCLSTERFTLTTLQHRLGQSSRQALSTRHIRIEAVRQRLGQCGRRALSAQQIHLQVLRQRLGPTANLFLSCHRHRLELFGQRLADNSPQRLLALGYSITLGPDGRAVRNASDLRLGDLLRTRFHRGEVQVEVKAVEPVPTND